MLERLRSVIVVHFLRERTIAGAKIRYLAWCRYVCQNPPPQLSGASPLRKYWTTIFRRTGSRPSITDRIILPEGYDQTSRKLAIIQPASE